MNFNITLFPRGSTSSPGKKTRFAAWMVAFLLMMTGWTAQAQLPSYSFSSTVDTYTPITGGTLLGSTSSDDQSFVDPAVLAGATGTVSGPGLPIGFDFTFNGVTFDRFGVNTNGWIFLGQSALSPSVTNIANSYVPLSVSNSSTPPQLRSRIAGFARDLQAQTGAELRFETIGTAPNRTLVVQFSNFRRWNVTTDNINFQIRLHEGSNNVSIAYGTVTVGAAVTVEVGLGGNTNADYNSRTTTTDWAATTSSTVPTGNMAVSPTIFPASGTTYTFVAPTCFSPYSVAVDSVGLSTARVTWRPPFSVLASGYEFAAVLGNTATLPSAGTVTTDTFVNLTGLTPSTPYSVFVRANCGGTLGTSNWVGPFVFVTGGPISSAASGLWSNPATWAAGAVPSSISSVTISAGDSVIYDLATASIEGLTINGVLGVNASAQRVLTVNGNVNIGASGSLNFGAPVAGTSLRILDLTGNFVNAGNSNMASGNAAVRFSGTTAQTFTNSGTMTNNAVGQIISANAVSLTLASPITVGFNLDLVSGVLNAGSNLTFDQTATGGANSQIRRSPLGTLSGTPVFNSTVFNLSYVFFVGQTSALITEGPEMPASRSINSLTISNPAGLNLTGDLTVNAATGALTLTSGIINLPAGGKITCTATGFAPTVGSATSFVNGAVEIVASTTSNTTRNFPVGSVINGVPSRAQVVMAGINTGGTPVNILVRPVGAPSGAGVAPVTATMGARAFEISASGPTGTATTVQLNWLADDGLALGTLAQVRIAQSPALTGPWTARSTSATTGTFTTSGARTSTAVDFANGSFFAWSTIAVSELAVTTLLNPVQGNGCFSGNQQVSAIIRNTGGDYDRSLAPIVLNAVVTGPNGPISLGSVTRATGVHPAGAFDTVMFTTPLNMAAMGNYVFEISMDSLAGQVRTNDTLRSTIINHIYTAEAVPANILINGGSNLRVTSPTDDAFISTVRFTEIVFFSTGTGQTAGYPAAFPTADFDVIELTNLGTDTADMSGFQVEILGSGPRVYTFPNGVRVNPGAVLNLFLGTGTDNPAAGIYWTGGSAAPWSSGANVGLILRNPAGNIADAVASNTYSFPAASGVQALNWSGVGAPSPSGIAGSSLVGADVNGGGTWRAANAAQPMTVGTNVGVTPVASPVVTWTGPGGFTASGITASTGIRPNAGVEQYVATVSYGACAKTDTAVLNVLLPVRPIAAFFISDSIATYGGTVTTITLADSSANVPTNWKWTVTPASGVNFVNGTADTTQNAQIQFSAPGTYSVKLLVSNPAGADSLTLSNAISASVVYCASGATSTDDTKIDSVILGTTITGTAEATCEAYTDFTDSLGVAATIVKTQPFAMSVKPGYCDASSYTAFGRVFIDMNKDGFFTADEAVADLGPLTTTGQGAPREWFNVNLVVPVTADTGVTRLRVVWRESVSSAAQVLGCGTYNWGETEDYNVRLTNPILSSPALTSPANNTFLNVDGSGAISANITWTPAVSFTGATSVTYAWQLASRAAGNFNAPLVTIAANNSGADTALTLNFAQIDATLASLNVLVGDTVPGIWRIRAIAGTDTVYSSNTWNIDIRRGTVTDPIAAFSLLAPPNNTILPISGSGSQTAQIRWSTADAGGQGVTYQWLAIAPGGNFNAPVVALNANGNGSDTALTLTYAAVDALLASLNFNVGDSVYLDWTVRATSGTFTRLATQTWRITLYRGVIAPLRIAIAPVGTTTTQVRAPNGFSDNAFMRAATFVPRAELAAAGIDSGVSIQSMAFRITAGANIANRGNFTLYLGNGQNVTYSRGNAWAGAINGLTAYFNDSLSLPTTAGIMTLTFSQPFVYDGGSIEIAYDWAAIAPFATTAVVTYAAASNIANSLVSANSATTAPTTMAATAFRPEFQWGVDDRKANDVEVISLFAKGQNPRQWGAPEVVQAIVRNNSFLPRTNIGVTLNVAGANTFTNTQTIANLGVDSVTLVNFSGFSGTSLGFNNMTVSVPNDERNNNNSKAWAQQQTDSIFSYSDTALTGTGSVGFNTGSGLLLTRFTITGNRSIRAARMRIGTAAPIVGNALRAVVLNDSGVIVAQSNPITITAAQLNTWVVFTFPNPANVSNGSFYIGMAQPTGAAGYFPMAFQNENPTRPNAYFTGPLAGGVVPSPVGGFRLMIEAHLGSPVVPVDSLSRFSILAPGNNTNLTLSGDPTQTVTIRWNRSVRSIGTTPVSYRWLLDVPGTTFTNPVVTVNAGTDTSLTLTYGQIVDTLASRGIQVGQGFTGRWTVRAVSDSLNRLATLPFNITLNRGVMTSIEETDFSKSINLYPNPASYVAKLQVNGADKDLMITVVNAVGQEMKKFTVNAGIRSDIEIDLANLNEGLYFVRISDGSNLAVKRLMIQR